VNENVGDMPLEIFGDYLTDTLNEEWTWEYLAPLLNWRGYIISAGDILNTWFGNGCGFNNAENGLGWSWQGRSGHPYGNGMIKYHYTFGDGVYTGNGHNDE